MKIIFYIDSRPDRFAGHLGVMPFYINIVVVDKEEALNHVLENRPLIGAIASKVVSEETLSAKIAESTSKPQGTGLLLSAEAPA